MKKQKTVNYEEKVQEYFAQIQDQIESFNVQVEGVLTAHEQDFMRAFKGHIYQVQKQMQQLKNYSTMEQERKKRDKELSELSAALEWYKNEAQRLDESLIVCKQDVAKWKAKAQTAETDIVHLQEQVKAVKRELAMWKQKAERPASVTQSQTVSPVFKLMRDAPVRVDKTHQIVQHYQRALSQERRKIRKLNALTSQTIEQRIDLQEIFHECVAEVQKLIRLKNPTSRYMTSLDKLQILEMFVTNEQVLAHIQETLFPHKRTDLSFNAASPEYDSMTVTPELPKRRRPHSVVDGKLKLSGN
mmetsp:Transcript_25521/g.44485  ORF Transcript_25521/g.44485 Transcript_25521/m.44485 type:complete len:301 (+) Transcript_25521:556-1458(+)